MTRRSLVTKIVLSACGLLGILLLAGSVVFIAFEVRMLRSLTGEHRQKIVASIDEREQAERETLRKNVRFHARILSEISAVQLYDVNTDGMQQNLQSYLSYPEIVAIAIIDKYDDPFAAAWSTPLDNTIQVADALPPELIDTDSPVIRVDALLDGEKKGECLLYYTEALLQEKIAEIRQQAEREADDFHIRTSARLQNVFISQGIALALILVILIAALIILLRVQVIRPVKRLADLARKLRDLDLTAHAGAVGTDEIGMLVRAIDEMAHAFRQLIGQVQRSGIQVMSSSTELSATAKQQEVTIKNQVQSIRTTAASIQEISDVITELVQTMQQVASMSQETAGFANQGQADLAQMKTVMEQMEQASNTISGKLKVIHEKADSITQVMGTITRVADQTNLLSLNAAIEAEKAGDAGRGFAVVAREIRRLADQTAVATLDIGDTVEEMRVAVSSGVMEMDTFMAEVRHSTEMVAKIGMQLSRIITQVQALSPNFDGVNTAIEHQSDNVRTIRQTIVNLHAEMEETAASLHESFMAIGELNEASRNLQSEVSRFIVE